MGALTGLKSARLLLLSLILATERLLCTLVVSIMRESQFKWGANEAQVSLARVAAVAFSTYTLRGRLFI